MKRRSLIKAGFVATAMTFGLTATAAMAETVTLRMATWLPPKHHHTAVALPAWIAAIDEASGGTLKIKIDPAPIAKPPGQYDIVRDGAADMSYHVVAYTPGPFEILRGVELPFLSPNAEIGSQAAYDWYDRNVGFDTEFKDVKIITMFVHGPGAVHTKTPVKTLEDLAGVKLRVGGGGVRMSEALGATPVAMPASKAYEAIQKGVADGAMFPFESIAGFRLGELVNYHLEIPGGLYTTPFAVMMNPAKYDSLSDEHKKVLADVGGVAGAKIIGAAWDDADAIGRQAAVDQGGVFHTLEGAELARWTDAIAFMDGSWIEKANAAGHDGAALLEDLKATIAKYSN
jgi:TRAP-type C4-dicarboxylate transport system substrate-binding protein